MNSIPPEFKSAILDQLIAYGVGSFDSWIEANNISYSYFRIALREMEREELITISFAQANTRRGFRPLGEIKIVA